MDQNIAFLITNKQSEIHQLHQIMHQFEKKKKEEINHLMAPSSESGYCTVLSQPLLKACEVSLCDLLQNRLIDSKIGKAALFSDMNNTLNFLASASEARQLKILCGEAE